jgi:hypothetical protein
MASHRRQTARLSETLRLIGYVLGGEAGVRLADRLGINTSPERAVHEATNSIYLLF